MHMKSQQLRCNYKGRSHAISWRRAALRARRQGAAQDPPPTPPPRPASHHFAALFFYITAASFESVAKQSMTNPIIIKVLDRGFFTFTNKQANVSLLLQVSAKRREIIHIYIVSQKQWCMQRLLGNVGKNWSQAILAAYAEPKFSIAKVKH